MEEERKRKTAVALRYEKDKESAPQITATGKGVIAEKIIEIAKEYNIPIHEDPELVSLLAKLNLGELIPSSTYQVVAEILAWVYSLNKQRAGIAHS